MLFTSVLASCLGLVVGFCSDGLDVPELGNDDVVVTWAQAPLYSTNPQINQTGKYLNLFHTALIFRQDSAYWTLEFDSTSDDLSGAILPQISANSELVWDTDARWCLREGIYNGREHWTTNFTDVATIKPAQFLQIFYEHIPLFNATVPGAYPQYQFWRVQHLTTGELLLDDTTCSHVYRVLEYLRDVQQVQLLEADYKVTRVTLPTLGAVEVDMSVASQKDDVVKFYTALQNAVGGNTGVDALKAIFEFFMPWKYVFEPISGKYYKINLGAPGEVILLFFVSYDLVGDLPPAPGSSCDVAPACTEAMAAHTSYGMGKSCKAALGAKSDELVAGGCHSDATTRAKDVACFCGSECYVESSCLQKMNDLCGRGGGDSCKNCIVWHFPQLSLFGPCSSSWGAKSILDTSMARSCFCDDSQWKPTGEAKMMLA